MNPRASWALNGVSRSRLRHTCSAGSPKLYRCEETVGNEFGGVQFLPSTFYIGRDGKVVDNVLGLKKKE